MRTSLTVLGVCPPKPRMTQADKWRERPAVLAYRTWCDECRLAATGSPTKFVEADVLGVIAFFHLPVPESWPEEKKRAAYGRMHREAGDVDNRKKSVLDSLFRDDKRIAFIQAFKLYVEEGEPVRTDIFLLVA